MNKKFKSIVVFVLILAMVLGFTACGGNDSEDTVLANIKDTEITESQIDGCASYYSLLSLSTPRSELGEQEAAYLKGVILNFTIEVELLKQHFKDAGTEVLPDDFDEQFSEYKDSLLSQGADMEKQLEDEGITDDTLKFFFSAQFYTRQYMEDVDREQPVTDTAIKAYYDENKEQLVSPAQIKASHILVKDEKHTDAGRTSIEAIKARIDSGEATFADIAGSNADATAQTKGDLGWFSEGDMVPEFSDVAFALKKNEMSDVVETNFGYHLILLTDRKAEHQKTLEEATEEIKMTLEEQNYAAGIESLKEQIKVEYTDAGNKLLDTGTGNGTSGSTGGAIDGVTEED